MDALGEKLDWIVRRRLPPDHSRLKLIKLRATRSLRLAIRCNRTDYGFKNLSALSGREGLLLTIGAGWLCVVQYVSLGL